MISQETRAEVCRLVRSEHMSITQTAKVLGIHHGTVRRVLESDGRAPTAQRLKRSGLDPFAGFITQKLADYPSIKASNIWLMLKDRGYKGCQQTVRDRVRLLRGQRSMKAFMPITAFAGDEAQVDWAHFGTMKVGKATRKLSCFLAVLSYFRGLFAKFFFDQTMESFLTGHVEAFKHFSGVPRQIRYDNLKAAVVERHGQAIRYNDHLLELAAYYAFKPAACNPYAGHEKGRVERAVRYIREGFFVGREFSSIDKLNTSLSSWLENVAQMRPWPDDKSRLVSDVVAEEKEKLIALPAGPFMVAVERPARSGKIPLLRFDRNDYSIPFQHTGVMLSLSSTCDEVLISHQGNLIARHRRTYSVGEKIIEHAHFERLLESRPGAHTVAARTHLINSIPACDDFFRLVAEQGGAVSSAAAKIGDLLRTYGKSTVKQAVLRACERGYGEANYVAQACEQLCDKRKTIVPRIDLPKSLPGIDLDVIPHDTSTYDELF